MVDNLEHLITQYYTDKNGNLQSQHIVKDYRISPDYNLVQLEGIIDEHEQIEIDGFHRVYEFDDIEENSFYIRNSNTVFFHPNMGGKTIKIEWYCIGIEYINASNVYTDIDGQGNVSKTIGGFIEELKDSIESLKNIKEIERLIPILQEDFVTAGQMHNSLELAIIKIEELLAQLDTKIEQANNLINEK